MLRCSRQSQQWLRPSKYLFQNHQPVVNPLTKLTCRQNPYLCHQTQRRQIFGSIFNQKNWDDIRFSPWKRRLFIGSILLGGSTFIGILWLHYFTVVQPTHNFPESVAKELRLAISFERFHMDPQKAAKHYQKAVYATGPAGMDPYSDECIGIRLRIISFLENYRQYAQAVEELKALRRDCVNWVKEKGDEHFGTGRRSKVLEWAVRASIHLGELYARTGARDPEQAEEALVWAVDTLLKEKRRREVEGVREGEGTWIEGEQFGATIESLAHHYDEKELYDLSAPLFLQAVTLCPSDTCHAATLMNNLASSLAQRRDRNATTDATLAPSGQTDVISRLRARDMQATPLPSKKGATKLPVSFHSSLDVLPSDQDDAQTQAAQWAKMALSVAAAVPSSNRTAECEQAKCAAFYNLGEIAERQKNIKEARSRYGEARRIALSAGWEDGIKLVSEANARLDRL